MKGWKSVRSWNFLKKLLFEKKNRYLSYRSVRLALRKLGQMTPIIFRTISGRSYQMDVDPSEPVAVAKRRLAAEHHIDIQTITFLYRGKQLEDGATIGESGVDGSTFVIIFQPTCPVRQSTSGRSRPQTPPAAPSSPNPQAAPVDGIRDSPLPLPFDSAAANDPPDFQELVAQLLPLGFDQPRCEEALRGALYKPSVAVEYLLAGWAPNPPPGPSIHAPIDIEELEDESLAAIYQKLREIKDEHLSIDALEEFLKEEYPFEYQVYAQSPLAFITGMGFSVSDFTLAPAPQDREPETLYDALMGQFTREQREVIRRLESKGFDSMVVLQVFEACNCDENVTEECLKALAG
jgi:UV excision repair protein RAD23